MGYSEKSIIFWKNNIEKIKSKKVNAWDDQWFLSLSAQNQLSIVPSYNLVSNIGFGEDATHTFGASKQEYLIKHDLTFPFEHPKYILPNLEYENKYEALNIKVPVWWKKLLPNELKKIIKKLIKHT